MTNAQKVNKHLRTKRMKATTTKGARGRKRPKHGIGKAIRATKKKLAK